MRWALVVDDASILLLICIILLLAASIYSTTLYQPLVHPLLLSRQASVSPIRRKGESAVYRNANVPAGFDLASQPRKAIHTVADIVRLGSGAHGWSFEKKRKVYGVTRSNEDILGAATAFARGLTRGGFVRRVDSSDGTSTARVGISVEVDSLESLQVILSGGVAGPAASGRFAPLVIAPAYLKAGQAPSRLPGTGSSREILDVLYTTTTTLKRAADLAAIQIIDESTVLVFASAEEVDEAKKIAPRYKAVSFADVIAEARDAQTSDESKEMSTKEDSHRVHTYYWTGKEGWAAVDNASLVAGVSAHLAMFPAEAHPTPSDCIFVEQSPYIASPSLRLGAGVTPAGLVFGLLALYSGSTLAANVLSSSISDPNPIVSSDFEEAQPTIIFASPAGASSLAACLCTVTKRSPLAWIATHGKLVALRHGVFSRKSIWDRLLFDATRTYTSTTQVRLVALVGEGPTVGQSLLDVMRAQLGCAIRSMYLPANPLIPAGEKDKRPVVLPTAPLTATHSYDLQAFAPHLYNGRRVPAHVGSPNVAVELKLVETADFKDSALGAIGVQGKSARLDLGRADDPFGEILVRGTIFAGFLDTTSSQQWYATGDTGTFRSNGTLVVIRDKNRSPDVDTPTLSAEYPTLFRTSRLGSGGAETRRVPTLN